jgi:uncharacterized damage-inducible protein DinB
MTSRRRNFIAATRLLVLLAVSLSVLAAQESLLTQPETVEAWKVTKAYTLAVAEAMPADSYDFRPVPEEFTFAVQMIHLAHTNYSWFTKVLGEPRTIADPKSEQKADVLAYLEATFDYCIGALGRVTARQLNQVLTNIASRAEGSGRDALLNMYLHTAHHRGQAVVYLRLKGIKPPQYSY